MLKAVIDGGRPIVGDALRVSLERVGREHRFSCSGARFSLQICANDKPLVTIWRGWIEEGDTLTVADVHKAFELRLSDA